MHHNDPSTAARVSSTSGRTKFMLVGLLLIATIVAAGIVLGNPFGGTQNQHQPQAALPAGDPDPFKALQALAQCMRDNGIAEYPDPTENGINLNGTGIDVSTPEFQAARKICEALLPEPPRRIGPEGERRRDGSETRRNESGGNTSWQKVAAGGDCECADGSEFYFFDHRADPAKVVFYLDGGGVCFDAVSCANQNTPGSGERPGPDYDPNLQGERPEGGGMFDLARADNPFRGYSFIYVPLCTADAHLGNATREYSPKLTVAHKGFVNGSAALDYLAKHYPDASQVVVVGKTAGGAAAPVYGGIVSDLISNARITVFSAQSGGFPDDPDLNARIGEFWGAFDAMPDWEVNQGLTARELGSQARWIQPGLHAPGIVMARFNYAFDPHTVETLKYLSVPGIDPENPLALIDAGEAAIEAAGVELHSFTAPGDGHGILEFESFYELEVNGVRLVDWLQALLDNKPLGDVHCDPCAE